MATKNTGKKKRASSSKKASSSRKTSARGKSSAGSKDAFSPMGEVVLLLVILGVILMFLSLLGVCGMAGDVISKPVFGLFGIMGYVFPFVLAAGIFLLVANNFSGASKIKLTGLCITFLSVCALFQHMDNRAENGSVADMYAQASGLHVGGGVAGGLIDSLLQVFGFGALVILFIMIIVGLVILTERSFIKGVRNQSEKVYTRTKENLENYRMDADIKQTRRMEKKASGVVFDTELPKDGLKHSDVREINDRVSKKEDRYSEDIFEVKPVEKVSEDIREKVGSNAHTNAQKTESYIDRIVGNAQKPKPQKQTESVIAEANTESIITGAFTQEDEAAIEETPANEVIDEVSVTEDFTEEIPDTAGENDAAADIEPEDDELEISESSNLQEYKFPSVELLNKASAKKNTNQAKENAETARTLQQTLQSFGVNVTVTDVSCGPSVTRYELLPERGTKVSKIVALADDIKLNLAAADIRIEAPIPGKAAVGIEVPNKEASGVSFRELVESSEFINHPSKIAFAAGKDISGKVIVADIAKMPHLLIAGATGSGKSVCINTIIMSILYKARPDEVKLILVDPKVVELSMYNSIPHLLIPVVTDPKKASQALNWAVAEMDDRYKKFAKFSVRDLKGYNEKVEKLSSQLKDSESKDKEQLKKLPQIVIVIDELADLMMVAAGDVEDAICRLAQLARACGIHLVIATQRPSVNVITGLIKANVPSRIAFSVSSGVDSRTILDMVGAEKLLGKGDMLFYPSGYPKPVRAQGAFVSDAEVSNVVDFLAQNHGPADHDEDIINAVNNIKMEESQAFGGINDRDQYFAEAGKFVIEKERASIGLIQRFYKVGFNRAARIMDQLTDAGVVGPEEGTKPRKILMTMEEFEAYLSSENE
jgi:S-DNA-T family DNA segregation ATPase FtsK/SpoIIIE